MSPSAEIEAALQDAMELLDEMIGYVPKYFSEKWDFVERIERIQQVASCEK